MSTREVIFKMLEEKTKDELKLYQEKKLDGISEIKKEKNELIRKLKKAQLYQEMKNAHKTDKLKSELIEQFKETLQAPEIGIEEILG